MTDVDFRQLTDEEKSYAAIHLNENEETREKCIEEIRQWYCEKGGPHSSIDDNLILRFLRSCKYNVEATKIKLNNYCIAQVENSEYLQNLEISRPHLRPLLKLGTLLKMNDTDPKKELNILIRVFNYDPKVTNLANVFKITFAIMQCILKADIQASVYGVNLVADLKPTTPSHIFQVTPKFVRLIASMCHNCNPILVKGLYIINAPTIIYALMKLFTSLLTRKLRKRIHILSDPEHLVENLSSVTVPSDYGGTGISTEELIKNTEKMVLDNEDWLKQSEIATSEWVKHSRSKGS